MGLELLWKWLEYFLFLFFWHDFFAKSGKLACKLLYGSVWRYLLHILFYTMETQCIPAFKC